MSGRYRLQRAAAAFRPMAERSSGLSLASTLRAFAAFLALEAAFLGVFRRPRATAAGFFFTIARV